MAEENPKPVKQCPLKMAAAMTQRDINDMHKLLGNDYGYSLCSEKECAWWDSHAERCAPLALNGTIRDQFYELVAAINKK